jgi:hypothetical protein
MSPMILWPTAMNVTSESKREYMISSAMLRWRRVCGVFACVSDGMRMWNGNRRKWGHLWPGHKSKRSTDARKVKMVAWFLLDAAVLVPVCVAALVVVRLSIVEPVLPNRTCQLGAPHPPKGMGDSALQKG